MIPVNPFRGGHQPVQARDRHAARLRTFADAPPLRGRNLRHRLRDRERRDLHPVISRLRREPEHLLHLPPLAKLIAHREFHRYLLTAKHAKSAKNGATEAGSQSCSLGVGYLKVRTSSTLQAPPTAPAWYDEGKGRSVYTQETVMKLSALAREMCDEMAELEIIDAHSHLPPEAEDLGFNSS